MATDEHSSFGRWLRQRRRALGLTQAELGQRIGYSKETLRKVEANVRSPSRQMAEQIAECLGISSAEREAFFAFARPGWRLADLPQPLPTAEPVTKEWSPPAAALPIPPTELIGREQEVADLQDLLKQGTVRLVTLTGPPGVGKTRLAIAVAAGLDADLADGIAFVALSGAADPGLVVPTIARALGVPEAASRSLHRDLQSFLRPRHFLLVLDNFEQVVEAAPELSELLAVAPGLRVLVTSRERLRVRGEHVVVVPALSLTADPARSIRDEDLVASLGQSAAARLFIVRARETYSPFTVTSANAAAISAICHQLDGLPLAIELAAAHSHVLPPRALLSRLSHGLKVLQRGARDLPERQQSMQATIAWSYNRLGLEEQRLFRRLVVFVGGWTVEAAACVAVRDWGPGTGGTDADQTYDRLEALVDRSLLHQEEHAGPGGCPEPRFGMLETLRAYARERLAQAAEEEEAQRRQCAWCVALAESAELEVRGAEQVLWMERLDREQDNLRAALTWSLEHDALAASHLGKGLWRFWRQRGYLSEGRRWLEAILERTRVDSSADPAARGWVLVGAGIIATLQGDLRAARPLLAESVLVFRALGDPAGLAQTLRDLGYLMLIGGDDPKDVRETLAEALRLAQERGDSRGIGAACYLLALLAEHELDYPRAEVLTEDS
ncbi:MAG: ATP-binding protein, partial [Candidatus Dormibacteraceae bacterium]